MDISNSYIIKQYLQLDDFLYPGWSSTWGWDRQGLQGHLSWSTWEDCAYNEARDAGLNKDVE